jgi:hypothetical protein
MVTRFNITSCQPHHPITIGEKLRHEMQREARRLLSEWKISVSHCRRTEIARQISAINLLLGMDVEDRIGRSADD